MSIGITTNGNSSSTSTLEEMFGCEKTLANMNGTSFFAYCMWSYPDDVYFDELDLSTAGQEYLQCAGSAEAMSVEIRILVDDGYEQYAIRREPLSGECNVVIPYDAYSVTIYPSEVFTAKQAALLFDHYLKTTTIPEGYHLRLLDL